MAASSKRSTARIRIADVSIPDQKKIPPFWLLVQFDICPCIRDVEKKILSVLDSFIDQNLNEEKKRKLKSRSCPGPDGFPLALALEDPDLDLDLAKSEDSHCKSSKSYDEGNQNVPGRLSCSERECSKRDKKSKDLDLEDLLDSNNKRPKLISCQLWMDDFLLLSSESSEIFQSDDLVVIKCIREMNVIEENGTIVDEHSDKQDCVRKSHHKKQKKKRKHDDLMPVASNCEQNREQIGPRKVIVKDDAAITGSQTANCLDNHTLLDMTDHSPRKSKRKKSKGNEHVLEGKGKSFKCSDGKGVAEDYDIIDSTVGANTVASDCHNDFVKGADVGTSQINSDLLSLVEQRIEELTKNQVVINSPEVSKTQTLENDLALSVENELQVCNNLKRKRRRKRKKKANVVVKETVEKTDKIEEKNVQRYSFLKLAAGNRPENKRLTFQSDSESEEISDDADTHRPADKSNSGEYQEHCIINSSPSFSFVQSQNKRSKGSEKNQLTPLAELPNTNIAKKNITSNTTSDLNITNLSVCGISPSQQVAQGQSLDPNSKFDELLQRRRLRTNNCSVSTLCNGAYIFTRERQRDKKKHGIEFELPTMTFATDLPFKEKVPNVPELEDTAMEVMEDSSLVFNPPYPPKSDLVEVRPLYLDIERCKPLEGVPRTGDIIAYKILELSDDYTPVLSDYKQGQVTSCEENIVHIELFTNSVSKKKTGRFELQYEEEEEEEKMEDNHVIVELCSMVDVRLVQKCR